MLPFTLGVYYIKVHRVLVLKGLPTLIPYFGAFSSWIHAGRELSLPLDEGG